jgi:nucleoside-diphosphate-sugar epimerase
MKIFVTGATGYIGFAVASALASAGHKVYGLVRSNEKGKKVAAAEVEPIQGSMSDPSSYSAIAEQCQVFVHCASEWTEKFHDLDRLTMETLIRIAAKSNHRRRVIYTSGVWLYGNTDDGSVDENSDLNPTPNVVPRVDTEKYILGANDSRVSTIILRPGCVYGGSGSLTATWFESAVKEGAARIVGDGNFRWAMVHIQDLANCYIRAVETHLSGEIFNVTDRSRFTVLECATAASKAAGKGGKVQNVPIEEARKTMGVLADCLALNQHADSSKAVRWLGWQPRHGGFVDGADRYFTAWRAIAGNI